MDAVHRGTTVTIVASAMGALGDILYIVVLSFHLVDDVQNPILYTNTIQQLTVDDVMFARRATTSTTQRAVSEDDCILILVDSGAVILCVDVSHNTLPNSPW